MAQNQLEWLQTKTTLQNSRIQSLTAVVGWSQHMSISPAALNCSDVFELSGCSAWTLLQTQADLFHCIDPDLV